MSRFSGPADLPTMATQTSPGAGRLKIYPKSDNLLYGMDALGVEKVFTQPSNTPSKNLTLIWNGTTPVWAAAGTSFIFANSAFSSTAGGTINSNTSTLIGPTANVWQAAGMTFSASYSNGPATGATVNSAVANWVAVTMTGTGLQGPTASTAAVNYPAAIGNTIVFTLNSANGAETDADTLTFTFLNRRYWGVSTKTSGYTSADVAALTSELSNGTTKAGVNIASGTGQYLMWASRTALGTRTFSIDGLGTGGFNAPETVSVTNASGYIENYYVYRSTNANLGNPSLAVVG